MSSRRSGRAKAPVKYTSASEASDFEDKKPRKAASKKAAAPKKRTKAEQDPDAETDAAPKKRAKKSPDTLPAEPTPKAAAQQEKADKAAHKKAWEAWVKDNSADDAELLTEEPAKEESITQTDSLKKYGLKATELGSLKHFEKRNPVYNNTMKLFREEDVKALGFRKHGMLAGETEEKDILEKGEQVWNEEHKDDEEPAEAPATKPAKAKTPKQKWSAYVDAHTVAELDALKDEPEDAVNQSECKTKYKLVPADLAVLPHFPKPNQKYGQTAKLFKESEVKTLAYRKAAVLEGVEEEDEVALLKKGEELFGGA